MEKQLGLKMHLENICTHQLTQKYQIGRGNRYVRGLVVSGQPHPTLRGRGPSAPQF